jgi:tetratricopeptide (TPR) repeat protein
MMRRHAFVLSLGLLSLGCNSKTTGAEPTEAPARTPIVTAARPASDLLLDRPRTAVELPTTNAEVFVGNLHARLDAGRTAWKRSGSPLDALMLVGPVASSGKLDGDLDRIREAVDIATLALKKSPNERALLLARADANAALHRFGAALTDAKRAHAISKSAESDAMLADLAWNLGDYASAIAGIRSAAETPSFSTLVRLAQLELELGNLDAADQAFARAETLVKDVSPVPVAWLNVQRGLSCLHTGRFEHAELFYREAVARMPRYPLAVEHLAEIEALLGKRDLAAARYRQVVAQTNNPELMGALAGVLDELGDAAGARDLRSRAAKRYSALLRSHPEAMYWHAADFHLEQGDPERARSLLEKNARLRPNATSYAALANAELAAGKLEAAAKTIERALSSPVQRAEIFYTAARIRRAQGRTADARCLEADAKRLNPRIADLEGTLDPS